MINGWSNFIKISLSAKRQSHFNRSLLLTFCASDGVRLHHDLFLDRFHCVDLPRLGVHDHVDFAIGTSPHYLHQLEVFFADQ